MKNVAIVAVAATVNLMFVLGSWGGSFVTGPLVEVSTTSPFAGCTADNLAEQPGKNFPNSEVEPWVDVNPSNPANIVGSWQQDRWSNGGSRGLVAGVSFDGGVTWTKVVIPKISLCAGGTVANGFDYERATDPWHSFAPNGHLYFTSLSFDQTTPDNAILVSKSTDGGLSWSDPITVLKDTTSALFNDKQSITADPGDSNFVYLVWDRLQITATPALVGQRPFATENVAIRGRTAVTAEGVVIQAFSGPTLFSRTTNGGASWEPARVIYNPGINNQTIGNQIVVLPNGTLVNFFTEFIGDISYLALIRSTNKGATWTPSAIRPAVIQFKGVIDPEMRTPVRTEDFLPEVAVDATSGVLYAVWQDSRFSGGQIDEVAFSLSMDGGFTWTAPIKINRTPVGLPVLNRQAFTPSVDVADDGTIAVTYYDFRNSTRATRAVETDYWIVHCHASADCTNAANWVENRVTVASFDLLRAPSAGGLFLGDYEGLASVASSFTPFFAATKGSQRTNIYFRRVGP